MPEERTCAPLEEPAREPDPFLAQWPANDFPACDEGVAILRRFSETYPTLYAMALRNNFDQQNHPAFATNAVWQAYVSHRTTCPKCNEE